jgi:hypothetical protein
MGGLGGYATGQRMDSARQNEQLNQQQVLQDMYQEQQMNPIRLRQAGLNADTTEAQLPGMQADSWTKQRNQKVREGISLSDEQRAQLSKMAAQMTEDDWRAEEAALQKAAVSSDPLARAHAAKVMPLLKEFQMEKLKNQDRTERDQALQELKNKGALDVANTRAQVMRDAASLKQRVGQLKMTPQQAITYYRDQKSKVSPDSHEYQVFDQLEADSLRDAYALQQLKPVQPGSVNAAEMTKLPEAKPVQPPATTQFGDKKPAQSSDYSNWSMQQWKQRYPNVPDEQLRNALKAKGFTPK